MSARGSQNACGIWVATPVLTLRLQSAPVPGGWLDSTGYLASLDKAFQRAREHSLPFIPLYLDAANPSPAQGWNGAERKALEHRGNCDALLALAFIHHLAIGRNVPLDWVVEWITGLSPCG